MLFQRKPLVIVPSVGPWLMTYGHAEHGITSTGVMVTVSSAGAHVSGGRKGHRALMFGVRWRRPRATDWTWNRTWPSSARGSSHA